MAKDKPTKTGRHQSAHQKAVASQVMKRLRATQPEKFTKQKKPKPPVATPAAPPEPTPQPETKPATPPPMPAAPPVQPSPPAAPMAAPAIQPDTALFGNEEVQPPKIESGNQPPPPPTGAPLGTPGSGAPAGGPPPEDVRKYAVIVWGMIVKICCSIFGDGFKPITLKTEAGEVLYDENAEGVKVWWNWLVSIGVRAFSPLVELWLFMISYFTIRFPLIVARFRKKKTAPTGTPPPDDKGTPEKPLSGKEQPPETPPPARPESETKPEPPAATPEQLATASEEFR